MQRLPELKAPNLGRAIRGAAAGRSHRAARPSARRAGAASLFTRRHDGVAKGGAATGERIRFVFFDLGGTLLDEGDYLTWAELARRFSLEFDADVLAHAFREVEREIDAEGGSAGVAEFWRRTLARAADREVSAATAQRFVDDVARREAPAHLFSDVRRCLEDLANEHRTLGIISNSRSEASVRGRLDRAGIVDQFATVTSSGTEGIRKPDPQIFRRALARARARAEESFYVGNLEHTDARAARAAGIASVWLNREGEGFNLDPPEVNSLLEVPNWVRRLEGSPEKYPARRR